MTNKKFDKNKIEKIIFLCFVALIGIFFVIFYRRFIKYSFDIDHHRWFAELLFKVDLDKMKEIDYSIPVQAITYPVFHLVVKAIAIVLGGNYHWGCYLALSMANMMSIVLFRMLIERIHTPRNMKETILTDIFSVSLILFVVLRSPLTEWRFYARQCAANPVQNPTILFVRPFAILAFMLFGTVITNFNKGEKYTKPLIWFGVMTLLSVFTKPNYAIVFLPAMGIITLVSMIEKKSLKIGLALMGAVLPSLVALLWQMTYVSGETADISMHFEIGGFSGLDFPHILMASVATFPVVLVLFSVSDFKENIYYRVSIIALVIGWLQMFMLSDGPSGNFSWGYDLAVQFATLTTLAMAMGGTKNKVRTYIAYALFALQVVSGIHYIALVFANFEFMI